MANPWVYGKRSFLRPPCVANHSGMAGLQTFLRMFILDRALVHKGEGLSRGSHHGDVRRVIAVLNGIRVGLLNVRPNDKGDVLVRGRYGDPLAEDPKVLRLSRESPKRHRL